jgi:hypothetical protein
MRTRIPSIRTLIALAYERGEEFDPALMLSPTLAEQLDDATAARATDFDPSPTADRQCRLESSRRRQDQIEDFEGAEDIEGSEAYVKKMGITQEGLRELEMCPFLEELTSLNQEPLAVIEARYFAEQACQENAGA